MSDDLIKKAASQCFDEILKHDSSTLKPEAFIPIIRGVARRTLLSSRSEGLTIIP